MDVSKIIDNIPKMKLRDTVSLWRNTLGVLDDKTKRKLHWAAQCVLEAVEQEWIKRHKGPSNQEDWFQWPSTDAQGGSGQLQTEDWEEEGALKYMGYRVGNTDGEPTGIRHQILSRVFEGPIPPAFPPDYLDEWGEPGTAARLRKLAESIAAFTRNAKRKRGSRMQAAIRDWESDLEFLFDEYYVGKFQFDWPDSSI